VISTWPYAVVRHPSYAYTMLLLMGTSFAPGLVVGPPRRSPGQATNRSSDAGREALLMDGLPHLGSTLPRCASVSCPDSGDQPTMRGTKTGVVAAHQSQPSRMSMGLRASLNTADGRSANPAAR
jgi:hypothetical protein